MAPIRLPPAHPATSLAVRSSMRGNRSSRTKPEIVLTNELRKAEIKGFQLNCKDLPGSPDLVFQEVRLAVFIHGCFWHRCPYCQPHFPNSNQEYWEAKFARNKARDIRSRAELRSQGWKTMVVWECQLKKNARRVVSRIRKALQEADG
jgi:DNA mismatch endonuclease (patch repair protein)